MEALKYIENIADVRVSGKIKHNFCAIIFTTLCAIVSGCENWGEISDYCEVKKAWLSQYVDLSHGVPSEWTFRRLFTTLDARHMEHLLRTVARCLMENGKKSDQIAIDGKALLGSKRGDMRCLHSVSAWCHENHLVIGEDGFLKKSNEMTAIPLLIESLDIKGKTVSIDAAGCQKSIVKLIREKKGHYVLGLKRNQKKLYTSAQAHINAIGQNEKNSLCDTFDESYGRTVRRRYFGYKSASVASSEWADAKSIVAVETIFSRHNDPSVSTHWRYYLSDHVWNHKNLADYIRNHWSIENKLHWALDVHMREDDDQKSDRQSVRSFALLRRMALNILRTKDQTPKRSIKRKLRRAAMDNDYLLSLLA